MKKFLIFAMLGLMTVFYGLIGYPATARADEPERKPYQKTYQFVDEEKEIEINLEYKSIATLSGDVEISFSTESDEKNLERFQKYSRNKINSADIGVVFYVTITPTDPEDQDRLNGTFKYTIKLPKFYKNKELAVIPFLDERTTQSVKQVTVNDDGTITFSGNKSAFAYAIVYNGAYKQVVWIIIVLIVVLVLCIAIKIICLRKDNPEIKERKKQKAINKKKQQHKQNKKLAQELKREREKLKHKQKT